MRRLPLASGFALWLGAPLAQAQAPTEEAPSEEAVRFEYEAPPECPDVATFTARVRERTARGRIAEPGELARRFALSISADARGFSGGIEFLDDSGQSVSRRVHGEQCDEVVSSLALITALALDASLRPAEAEPAPAQPRPTPSEPRPYPGGAIIDATPTYWQSSAGARASARVGVIGGYRTGLDAFSLGLLGQLDWGGFSSRLTAHLASADREVEGRRANLRLLGVEVSLCGADHLSRALLYYFCPTLDVGSLRAQALKSPELTSLGSDTIAWVAVGGEARLAWEPEAPFWVELNGQLDVPLLHHRFIFENPEITAFEVPGVTLGLGIATGVRFW